MVELWMYQTESGYLLQLRSEDGRSASVACRYGQWFDFLWALGVCAAARDRWDQL